MCAGTFIQTKAEGYENILDRLEVSFLKRKAAVASTPTMEVSQNGTKWQIVTKTILTAAEINFEIGVPFEEVTGL